MFCVFRVWVEVGGRFVGGWGRRAGGGLVVGGLVVGALGCGLRGGWGEGRVTVAWDLGVVEAVVVEAWRRVERGRNEKVSTEKGSLGGMAWVA